MVLSFVGFTGKLQYPGGPVWTCVNVFINPNFYVGTEILNAYIIINIIIRLLSYSISQLYSHEQMKDEDI